jgi:hypothetical protein
MHLVVVISSIAAPTPVTCTAPVHAVVIETWRARHMRRLPAHDEHGRV